jgi:hypothetical protein
MRIREAKKHVDPVDTDSDPEHCFKKKCKTLIPVLLMQIWVKAIELTCNGCTRRYSAK